VSSENARQANLRHGDRGAPLRTYLDTSALLKLYLDEEGSALVRTCIGEGDRTGTSIVAYVETRAALARRHHAGDLSASDHRRIVREFEQDWERYARVGVDEPLVREAAALAATHRLRAYDAIHLASALALGSRRGGELLFASWDDRLDAAAAREGLRLLRRHR